MQCWREWASPHDADTAHSVRDAVGLRWPVVDGIPFLRAGRRELAEAALGHLDAGEGEAALCAAARRPGRLVARAAGGGSGLATAGARAPGAQPARGDAAAGLGARCRLFRASLDGPDLPRRLALAEAHWNAPGAPSSWPAASATTCASWRGAGWR
jgi:hypothetical protein